MGTADRDVPIVEPSNNVNIIGCGTLVVRLIPTTAGFFSLPKANAERMRSA
jgi:hypothetical protein